MLHEYIAFLINVVEVPSSRFEGVKVKALASDELVNLESALKLLL